MPKIIDEAHEKILGSAKRMMFEKGYGALSLRSVAKECGVAVGTIYNYFDSKDDLITAIIQKDWDGTLHEMKKTCQRAENIREGLLGIYHLIDCFCRVYENVWHQYSSIGGAFNVVSERHGLLLKQVSDQIISLLKRFNYKKDIEIAPLLAEMLLSSVMRSEIDLHQIDLVIQRLFQSCQFDCSDIK